MKTFYTLLLALCVCSIYAQPSNNASDPPARDAGDVTGIYGDTYTSISGINYDPDWGQSGHMQVNTTFDPGTGQVLLAYPNFNYQGTDFAATPQDISQMENLHVDIWVAEGTDRLVKVSPIDNSGMGPGEVLVEVPLVPGSWNSVDLPKSAFTDMSWNSVIQIKFDGQFNGDGSANTDPFDIYLDNLYFWKSPVASGNEPTTSPAAPTNAQADVVSIFSDAFTNVADINYDPDWGQSGHMQVNTTFDPGTGDFALAYPNFNYQGTDFAGNPQDASGMEFLHVDIWVAEGTDRLVKVSPIDNSGMGPGEVLVEVPLVPGSWNSVDLPKSAFTDMSWNSVIQIKFDGQFNGDGSANTDPFDIYLDNLYFWKSPVASGNEPTTSPAAPTNAQEEVVSIYSDAFMNVADINYDPDWGQSGHMQVNTTFDPGTGDFALAYPNFNYQGTDFSGNPQDASGMEFLHVDIWVPEGTDRLVKVTPIDNSGVGPGEVLVEVPIMPGSWNSVDIPKGDFTDMSWSSVIQIKFDGQFNSDGSANTDPYNIFLDNIYFWKEPTTSGTDATLSDLQVDGMTIPGFSPGVTAYTYGVEDGVIIVPEVTATTNDTDASAEVTQASAIPGDATVVVTGGDGTTIQTYTVSFFYESPEDGAPDPTDLEENVISLFSDVYMNVAVDFWNTEWSDATFEDVMINGNPTKKYTALGFNGIETTTTPVDASSMMHFNMNIWSPNMTEIKIKLVDFLGDGFAGPNGDTEAELTFPVTQNEWMTLSIPLEDFATAGMTAFSDLNQYIISSVPFGSGTLYVDNVYFSKMPTSSDDIEIKESVQVFPNPIRSGETLFLSESVKSIEILSLNGQILRKSNSHTIQMNDMPRGTYIAHITTLKGAQQFARIVVQ